MTELMPPPRDPEPKDAERRRPRHVATTAITAIKAEHAVNRTWVERTADRLNDFAASASFLVAHLVWFLVWIPWNAGWIGLKPFDPYPFGFLTMVVSLEAIFLSIFVLMAQKRESAIAELREELSFQVALRIEQEVTKSLQLVAGLYTRLGYKFAEDAELHEMLQPLNVKNIERELLEQIAASMRSKVEAGRV